jgi:putative ABC transport system permease protein
MVRRELRSSWGRLIFFFLSIMLGVGAIVAGRSMLQNANLAIASEARNLLTADIMLDTNRPWEEATLEKISQVAAPPLVTARAETVDLATMLRPADPENEGALMVELKGIEPAFPLYGDFFLKGGERFDYSLLENNGAVVSVGLLDRLDLKVGDRVNIGSGSFEIRGAFEQEPGGSGGGFRLGPRVFIGLGTLRQIGLTGFGSRARHRLALKTQEASVAPLTRSLRAALNTRLVNVRSYKDSEQNMSEQFRRTEDYSSLVGLVILVLGGIGISNVTRVFIDQKKKSIAVLKCIGATGNRILAAYLAQIVIMAILGSLAGLLFAIAVLQLIESNFASQLPQYMTYSLRPAAAAQGFAVGLGISLIFSALPLLRIRRIKPNVLLREEVSPTRRRFDLLRWGVAFVALLALLMLVAWQAGSIKVGLFFLGGLALTAGLLYVAAVVLIWMVRRARRVGSFTLRQAINSLHRPGNQTRVIVMVVGLGVFLVISIQSIQSNLLREFDLGRYGNLPGMFLIDIQPDQQEGVIEMVQALTGERPTIVPTVRMRMQAINGREINFEDEEMRRDRGRLGREYVVTYRPHLESNETILEGNFWDTMPSAEPEVSIEEGMKGLAGLDLGGTITFDVQGRRITATVTSIRRVDWRNSRTGFMVLFRPGSLENAPQTMIAPINAPADELERSRFQRRLADRYPNVTVIDVVDIVQAIKRIVENISLAISFVGAFVLLTGIMILAGSLAMTKFQRIYETALLKTLGAKRKVVLSILLAEYGLLGLVAGIIGSGAATGLSYATSRYVFDIPWSFTPTVNLSGVAATILLVIVVGAVSTADVITRKPLATLRAQ